MSLFQFNYDVKQDFKVDKEQFNKIFTQFLYDIGSTDPVSYVKSTVIFKSSLSFAILVKRIQEFFANKNYDEYIFYTICEISLSLTSLLSVETEDRYNIEANPDIRLSKNYQEIVKKIFE